MAGKKEKVVEFIINEDGTVSFPDCSFQHMALLEYIDPELVEKNEKLKGAGWNGMGICG